MKETDSNITMMSILLGLSVMEGQKEEIKIMNWVLFKFKYPATVSYNHRYSGAVENKNAATRRQVL